jgi:hypothetical protein
MQKCLQENENLKNEIIETLFKKKLMKIQLEAFSL